LSEGHLEVLIEGQSKGISLGRSYRDAPEIDGMVIVEGEILAGPDGPGPGKRRNGLRSGWVSGSADAIHIDLKSYKLVIPKKAGKKMTKLRKDFRYI
jgi:hypothetical protein